MKASLIQCFTLGILQGYLLWADQVLRLISNNEECFKQYFTYVQKMGNSLSLISAKNYPLRWNCISFASLLEVGWYTVSINADLMDHKIVNFTPSTIWNKDEMDGRPSCSK